MTTAFLSYSTQDREVADAVAAALKSAGIRQSWPNPMPSPGEPFRPSIQRVVESADRLILLWSSSAARSEWVRLEMRLFIKAWSLDRLVLARLDETELPIGLRDIYFVDLTRTHRERGIQEIVRLVGGQEFLSPVSASIPGGKVLREDEPPFGRVATSAPSLPRSSTSSSRRRR